MEINTRNKKEIQGEIDVLEQEMHEVDFWTNHQHAQEVIIKLNALKTELETGDRYGAGSACISMYAGAGGDDSEDFVRILFNMYHSCADRLGLRVEFVDEHQNSNGGYKHLAFRLVGPGAYGKFKHEGGVHRLVRKSPFNAKSKRHTSFALVDVDPEIQSNEFELDESRLEISYTRSGGAGGQNVNKRETAVRVVDPRTGISVHVSAERSQHQNKERALDMMRAKLYKKHLADEEKRMLGHTVQERVPIEWGNQIRSYIFDPYQMVKDHRWGVDVSQLQRVLDGELELLWNKAKDE